MPNPVVATAIIGTAASVDSSKRAGRASDRASAGSLASAQQSEALNRERFALAQGYLDPYAGRANIAAQQLQAEMGLPQFGEPSTPSTAFAAPNLAPFGDPNMGPSEGGDEPYPPMPELYNDPGNHVTSNYDKAALAEWEQKKAEIDQRNRMSDAQESPYAGFSTAESGGDDHVYEARDISQIPGYQAAMDESLRAAEQSAVSGGGTAYGGRRLQAAGQVGAGVQQSYYTNYMNMLQNIANPTVATNLAGMGLGQAQSIGQQNIAAQNMASNYNLQGVGAQNAATADMMGGLSNMYSAYMRQPGDSESGTTPTNGSDTSDWSL